MLRRFGLICAVLSATPAFADTVTEFTLPNGLQAVVIEDHRSSAVTQMVWYRVGSSDEARGHSGIAHFLEHLMFKGTDALAPGEFSATVESVGGTDNAFTSYDYTAYFQRVSADNLPLMMQMEADRMRHLKLPEADVLTERDVILEERNQRTDSSPGALLGEQMRAAQFLNHPYGTPIIGWRHEIEKLSRQDALDHYSRYYAPNNAILVVAGDVTPDQVKVLAEKYYGPLAPSEGLKPRIRPQEPPQISERRITLADERVSERYFTRTYLAPERNSGDQSKAAALTMLAALLGGSNTTSVLARKLQFDSQTATYATAYYDGSSIDTTTFGFIIVPQPNVSLADAEAAMDTVLADFLKNGPDSAAFERIKRQIRASTIYDRDNTDGLARDYGEALAVGLTVADVQDWPDALAAVTISDVMAAAREVLNRNNAVTGWLTKPEKAAP